MVTRHNIMIRDPHVRVARAHPLYRERSSSPAFLPFLNSVLWYRYTFRLLSLKGCWAMCQTVGCPAAPLTGDSRRSSLFFFSFLFFPFFFCSPLFLSCPFFSFSVSFSPLIHQRLESPSCCRTPPGCCLSLLPSAAKLHCHAQTHHGSLQRFRDLFILWEF